MSGPIIRFSVGVCIVALALVLHQVSQGAASAQARQEGFQSGFRAWQNSQPDLTSACGTAGFPASATVTTASASQPNAVLSAR